MISADNSFYRKLLRLPTAILVSVVLLGLTGCEAVSKSLQEVANTLPKKAEPIAQYEALKPSYVRATGYAPISLQPAQTPEHKMLLAMRASRLNAYQELTAIVHGQYVFGTTSVNDMVLQNDEFKTAVAGIIRGARTVKTYPVNDDVYATILEVDANQLQKAWVSAQ